MTKSKRVLSATTIAIFLGMGALAAGLSACDREGPAERTGEKIDRAAERAEDKVKDATD